MIDSSACRVENGVGMLHRRDAGASASCCVHAHLLVLSPAPAAAVSAGPAAELLVAQLAGLTLHRLHLAGYRMLPGLLGSIAESLPALRQLALGVEVVEGSGQLELAALPRLLGLQELEIHVLPGRASAPDVTLAPLPAEASCLGRLTSFALLHVRPGQGEDEALWASLAHLPALQQLRYEQSGHAVRQPPAQLLRLETLTTLHIKVYPCAGRWIAALGADLPAAACFATCTPLKCPPSLPRPSHHLLYTLPPPKQIDGVIYSGDPPGGTWTQLSELPEGALPRLARLRLDCVGLLGLPASWCR